MFVEPCNCLRFIHLVERTTGSVFGDEFLYAKQCWVHAIAAAIFAALGVLTLLNVGDLF